MKGHPTKLHKNQWRYAVLVPLAFVYCCPVLYMLVGSLKPDARVLTDSGSLLALVPVEASLQNFRDVFSRVSFARILFNSVFITSAVVLGNLLVNSLAGYALARLRWPGRKLTLALILALLVIPFEAIAVPLFFQVSAFGWRDSYQVQILPFLADAFSIYLFYSFFLAMPRELEDAARIDGAGRWQAFFYIMVPAAKPVFATVAILTFLMRWGTYLWPLMVTVGDTYRPLPVAMAAFEGQVKQWGDIMAFGVLMVLPVLFFFIFCQRWFVEGVTVAGFGRKQ